MEQRWIGPWVAGGWLLLVMALGPAILGAYVDLRAEPDGHWLSGYELALAALSLACSILGGIIAFASERRQDAAIAPPDERASAAS